MHYNKQKRSKLFTFPLAMLGISILANSAFASQSISQSTSLADATTPTTVSAVSGSAINTTSFSSASRPASKISTAKSGVANKAQADNNSYALAPAVPINDPLQKFNRGVFKFNDKVDIYFMKPIATFYNRVLPKPVTEGVHNFFNNLSEIPTIANDLLQFHFYQMANDSWRLGINTTIGIGGLFDVAERINLPFFQNDFGLTMAYWGYTDSSYLVLPFLGSNTIRDGLGIPVDYYGFSVYPWIHPTWKRETLVGLFFIDQRATMLQMQSVMDEAAIDKYVFVRNAYMQHRAYQIEQINHLDAKDQLAAKANNK